MITATLELAKSTKGTHVYNEPDSIEMKTFPTIYIQKTAFPAGKPPESITVSVEFNK